MATFPCTAQEVQLCSVCETPVNITFQHCIKCHMNLCGPCEKKHLSDESRVHHIVPFLERHIYPKCSVHFQTCESLCVQCGFPLCPQCMESPNHKGHEKVDLLKELVQQKELMKRDLEELRSSIYPMYKEAASNIPVQKNNIFEHSRKLKKILYEKKEILHRKLETIIMNMAKEINKSSQDYIETIDNNERELKHRIPEIEQIIDDIEKMLDSWDFMFVSSYKCMNVEFKKLFPLQLPVSLPTITTEVNRELISEMCYALSELAIKTEEHDNPKKTQSVESSGLARQFINEPKILANIKTELKELCSISCQSDTEVWTCGNEQHMRLYDIQGELLTTMRTISGKLPGDIVVTSIGHLVYTDYNDRSVNIVMNNEMKQLIRLQGWIPLYLCSTFCDDLLVTMISDDMKQAKVVRYSGTTEEQSIQWDDNGRPLYTSDSYPKYLSENRNFDICLADCDANAVVVVSHRGKFRFRYTGVLQSTKETFRPAGIATDSQSRILTADGNNNCIHILDKDGQWLRNINNCGLSLPFGLCVDSNDNLYVAEWETGEVKKIQYYE